MALLLAVAIAGQEFGAILRNPCCFAFVASVWEEFGAILRNPCCIALVAVVAFAGKGLGSML